MDQRQFVCTVTVCLTIFFILNYSTTLLYDRSIAFSPIRYDHVIQIIRSIPKIIGNLSPTQINDLYKAVNTSVISIHSRSPNSPVFIQNTTTVNGHPKFPIQTPTFAIGLRNTRMTSNKVITNLLLGGPRANIFNQKGNDVLVKEVQPRRFDYIINNETMCKSLPKLDIVVSVYTATKNFAERTAVRQSWGRLSLITGYITRTVFFLGAVTDVKLQEQIAAESKSNGDIIQTNFIDSYHNLSLKGISQLQWLKDFCSNARYLVKADDDLYIDLFQVTKVLKVLSPVPRFIIGKLYPGSSIIRGGIKKWTVKRHIFPGVRRYPPYYLGWIYILPNTVFTEMHQAAMTTPVFHIDDVYITGLLAAQMPNFSYLTFKGKVPPGSFMPSHPNMAKICSARCKIQTFCKQVSLLKNEDKLMVDEAKVKSILAEEMCVKHVQEEAAKVKLLQEKKHNETKAAAVVAKAKAEKAQAERVAAKKTEQTKAAETKPIDARNTAAAKTAAAKAAAATGRKFTEKTKPVGNGSSIKPTEKVISSKAESSTVTSVTKDSNRVTPINTDGAKTNITAVQPPSKGTNGSKTTVNTPSATNVTTDIELIKPPK